MGLSSWTGLPDEHGDHLSSDLRVPSRVVVVPVSVRRPTGLVSVSELADEVVWAWSALVTLTVAVDFLSML